MAEKAAATPRRLPTAGRIGRPVGVDGDATRARIIDAARACFATLGYAATSTRMVADRSGLAPGALHHHYGKKKDLMLAVYDEAATNLHGRIRRAIDASDGFVSTVQALFDVVHEFVRDDWEMAIFASVARDEARRHPELVEIAADRTLHDLISEIIDAAVMTGEVQSSARDRALGAVTTMTVGLALVAADMDRAAHAVFTEGCKEAIAGSLANVRADQ